MATPKRLLLIGASRGLGYALGETWLAQSWHIVATVRGTSETPLHHLAKTAPGQLEIETLDITAPEQIAALHTRLAARRFDLLFVNAGTTNPGDQTPADVPTEEFLRVMLTNTLSPMRVVEALHSLVEPNGTIAVMSSGQGSVANNTTGNREIYRASKAALNTLMRSYAARTHDRQHTLLLLAPGWVRTEMGGSDAPLSIEDSIPNLVRTVEAQHGKPGLHYLDYLGRTVPW
jgi:NAD(P)-dependent dehydrogenase (short-subunit alcohol dehydrogenase family)